MNQRAFVGIDAVEELDAILKEHSPRKIFLVTGKKSFELSGGKSILNEKLSGYDVTVFNELKVNPQLEDIKRGLKVYKEAGCDFVIAIGGGSVIDVAKLINIFASNTGEPEEYVEGARQVKDKGSTFVALPTTAGAGSEATHFAVLYIDNVKHSLAHEYVLPDYAIVDPQFIMSLPKKIVAVGGMDALCQSVESYWGINSTDQSKEYAVQALELVNKYLFDAVNNPGKEAFTGMSKAAYLAGKAINITKTTAPHAVSYPITVYYGVDHGHAVALTLPHFMVFNYDVNEDDVGDERGVDYVRKTIETLAGLLGVNSVEEARDKILDLMKGIGLVVTLSDVGVTSEEDIKRITENVNLERLNNNPRKVTSDSLKDLLRSIQGVVA